MDEEIETLLVRVRADTSSFARDVAAMRSELDGPLAGSVDRAGRLLENSLVRAVRVLMLVGAQFTYTAEQQAADGFTGTMRIEVEQVGTHAASRPASLIFQ